MVSLLSLKLNMIVSLILIRKLHLEMIMIDIGISIIDISYSIMKISYLGYRGALITSLKKIETM
jgi:nitrogenase molybdenum-iron protein alpha/beta subunit